MRDLRPWWLATLVLLVACQRVADMENPKAYPYRFVAVSTQHDMIDGVDLDGDGVDELVSTFHPTTTIQRPNMMAVLIRAAPEQTLDQANFEGRLLQLRYMDFTGDGRPEILAPFVRNDSLFLTVVGGDARKLRTFFIVEGKPRIEQDGQFPWDPNVLSAFLQDADGNGTPDLVTVVSTGFARLPRGVFVHDVASGAKIGQVVVGSGVISALVDDFDGDGDREVALRCLQTDNGAVAGGFDDHHDFVHIVEIAGGPRLTFSSVVGGRQRLQLFAMRTDGRPRSIVAFSAGPFGDTIAGDPRLTVLDPVTRRVIRSRVLASHFHYAGLANLNRSPEPELFVASQSTSELLVLDDRLEVRERLAMSTPGLITDVVPDLDGDGRSELLMRTVAGPTVLLDADLTPLARVSPQQFRTYPDGIIRIVRRAGWRELISREAERAALLRLVPNRFYLLHRYFAVARSAALFTVVSLIGLVAVRLRRRHARLRNVQRLALDSAPFGLILLQNDGRVEWMNDTVQRWLHVNGKRTDRLSHDSLAAAAPDLAMFCRDLLALDPPRHREGMGSASANGQTIDLEFTAEPLPAGGGWLLRIDEHSELTDIDDYRTWALMAARVAHDIKNPLTTILLTLHRLRLEYQRHAPHAAEALDVFTTKIEDRISHLRRMTTNFTKLMHASDAVREPTVVSALMRERVESLRPSLPPDISISFTSHAADLVIDVDREQFESAIENLVTNAVNAMPNGGSIKISLSHGRRAQLPGREAPGDCAVIEIRDTGVGIPPENMNLIFEPGFSTTPHGSGLGLAITRRIVVDHGGALEIDSQHGSGTIATIRMPLAAPIGRELAHVRGGEAAV
jgi:nitrogen-specific signal transduction histidine kinase